MTARYAIYYAPPPESALSQRAAAWLGRDAFTGQRLERPAFPRLVGLNLDDITRDPRGYGFHATLKAPFELAPEVHEDDLLEAAAILTARLEAFETTITLANVGRFLAFCLATSSADIEALHRACVTEFDRFRAPLSDFDLKRRRKASLSAKQEEGLITWGYPYVFENFRFHMTLTGSLSDGMVGERVLAALKDYFADVAGAHRFDGVCVFKQDGRGAPFRVLSRFEFRSAPSLRAATA